MTENINKTYRKLYFIHKKIEKKIKSCFSCTKIVMLVRTPKVIVRISAVHENVEKGRGGVWTQISYLTHDIKK